MSTQFANFARLLDVAKETSSEKRRELLRQVTDALLAGGRDQTSADCAIVDEIIAAVSVDLSTQIRIELSRKVAASPAPFRRAARQFALDDIEIARPVLVSARALSENDLLDVIAQKTQAHMLAVTKRPEITERISTALVERGADRVVASLLENQDAKINSATYETITERAQQSAVLHLPLVRRHGVPLDLLSDLYLKVETKLRREILDRYDSVPPEDLDAAFERSHMRLAKAYGMLPEDYEAARARINEVENRGWLAPQFLISLMREGKRSRTAFIYAFSKLADVSYDLVGRLVEGGDVDAIALLCRAADFDRALFITIAVTIGGSDRRMGHAEEFGKLYENVPLSAAQRALRFWKVRAAA